MSDKAEYVEMKESRSSSMCCGTAHTFDYIWAANQTLANTMCAALKDTHCAYPWLPIPTLGSLWSGFGYCSHTPNCTPAALAVVQAGANLIVPGDVHHPHCGADPCPTTTTPEPCATTVCLEGFPIV